MTSKQLKLFLKSIKSPSSFRCNTRVHIEDIVEEDINGVAIFVPIYITSRNKGSWCLKAFEMLRNFNIPVFFGVSYPTDPEKWDVQDNDYAILEHSQILEIVSMIPPAQLLYVKPNMEHGTALFDMMGVLRDRGFSHMVHVEQDVRTTYDVVVKMVTACKKYDKKYLFLDMSL